MFQAVKDLQQQVGIHHEDALLLLCGYFVEVAAFILNDGAKIRELCEGAALDGMSAKQEFLVNKAKEEQ